ncbi:MAG: hypothetical protein EOO43_18975 [Flavobacterium sp.]|nr:MAG: hypothetical protein EOO43_18975 [Flavobacterium sp.]
MIQQPKQFYTVTLFLFFILVSSFTSCSKPVTDEHDSLYASSPSSSIPTELKNGIWFWGNVGPIAYYDRDGHKVGNGTEAAREYLFNEVGGKGRFEFTQYLGMRNASNCVTEIYTTKRGTVVFEGTDKLTLYPVEGSFRTVKKGCSSDGTSTRKADPEDLKPETMLWELKVVAGESLLYVYKETDTTRQDPLFVYSLAK